MTPCGEMTPSAVDAAFALNGMPPPVWVVASNAINGQKSEVVYLAQRGHDAVSFEDPADRPSSILPPHDGHTKPAETVALRLTFSTTTGLVRAWLKLMRGSKPSFAISPPEAERNRRRLTSTGLSPGATEAPETIRLMSAWNIPGGSDGARTRDLRRDRPTL